MAALLDSLSTAETPEGIELQLRPAGLVARFAALLIDLCARAVLLLLAQLALTALGDFGAGLLLIIYFLLEWLYPVVFELTLAGATPGKLSLGLRVVMDSGLPVTPAASLLRNLLRAADFLPVAYCFGVVSMLLRHDFKRLGDIAAGTLVVYARSVRLHGALPPAEPIAPRGPLSTAQQAVVVAWAGRVARLTPSRADELAALATPVAGLQPPARSQRLLGLAQWLIGNR